MRKGQQSIIDLKPGSHTFKFVGKLVYCKAIFFDVSASVDPSIEGLQPWIFMRIMRQVANGVSWLPQAVSLTLQREFGWQHVFGRRQTNRFCRPPDKCAGHSLHPT